jgi:hypothetical protein
MKSNLTILLSFIFIAVSNIFAQAGAIGELGVCPSVKQNSLGMTGTSMPDEDPSAFFYNPAQLGYIGQNNSISFQFNPSYLNFDNASYKSTSFNIGYNFNKLLKGLNISAGFGYMHSKFDMTSFEGSVYLYPSGFETDKFDAYGIGIGIDYFVQLNVGLTYKKITGNYSPYSYPILWYTRNSTKISSNGSAMDYGMLLIVPVTKLLSPKLQFPVAGGIPAYPYFNFSTGYALLNVSNGMSSSSSGSSSSYDLPRSARLGYTISMGLNIGLKNCTLKAFGYDFTADADDYLAESNIYIGRTNFQSFLGDISIGRHLLELKSDGSVIVHKGHNFDLFETVSFQLGSFDGNGYSTESCNGFGIQSKGIFKVISNLTNNYQLNFILSHLDIQYFSSTLYAGTYWETKFKGINIIWSGMTF